MELYEPVGPLVVTIADLHGIWQALVERCDTAKIVCDEHELAGWDVLCTRPSPRDLRFVGEHADFDIQVEVSSYAADIIVNVREPSCEPALQAWMEEMRGRLNGYRRRLRWLTHSDLSIVIGAAVLLLVISYVVPSGQQKLVAGVGAGLWLLYMLWTYYNQAYRWVRFRRHATRHDGARDPAPMS